MDYCLTLVQSKDSVLHDYYVKIVLKCHLVKTVYSLALMWKRL